MVPLTPALRTLFKNPVVTSVAIVSLALGIGANTAIFSLFDRMLLRPLPVHEPERLVNLGAPGPKPGRTSCNEAGDCEAVFSYPMFRDLERVQTAFSGLAGHRAFGANLAYRGQTLSGHGMLVSGGYFPALRLQPALGRLLGPVDDGADGGSRAVVLSHAYWRTRFHESPAVLNETLIVNGQALTIVGVAPRGFDGTTLGAGPQVFVPITLQHLMEPGFEAAYDNRRAYWVYLFARLASGMSMEQARAAVGVPYRAILNDVEAPLQKGMSDQTMARFRAREITLEPGARGQSDVHAESRTPLTLLLGVTALVLLIACANVANLLLVRGAARSGEMAVRLSLGATRTQLVAQLLAESCLLAAFAGGAGLLVARWTLALIASLLPADAAAIPFGMDLTALIFAAAVTLGTGLLFGLFPALHSTRTDLISTLKTQAGQPSGARAAARFRSSLATVQIALSMALLVAAGLFTKSLANVSRVNLGLRADNLLAFSVSPGLNGYTPERSRALFERLEEDLAALPGVTSVAASLVPLLSGNNWGSSVRVQGFEAGPDTDRQSSLNLVGPGYFRTLGIPLLTGREFTAADAAGAPKVAIVNERFARKFNLGRDAVGKRMGAGPGGDELDMEIVGVVQDSKYSDVKREAPPLFVQPYRQGERLGFITFYLRTSLAPELLMPTIPAIVERLDANLPVEDLRTMAHQVRDNVFLDRLITVLSAGFAALATLLAAVGLYGVLAYTVAQRTKEIGLRMALGAAPGRVRGMVLRQVGLMTVVGASAGLAAALLLGRFAASLLYQLDASDPKVLGAAAGLLTVVALGAGFVPALRASQIDPMRALRYD
jgi:predicted permease